MGKDLKFGSWPPTIRRLERGEYVSSLAHTFWYSIDLILSVHMIKYVEVRSYCLTIFQNMWVWNVEGETDMEINREILRSCTTNIDILHLQSFFNFNL